MKQFKKVCREKERKIRKLKRTSCLYLELVSISKTSKSHIFHRPLARTYQHPTFIQPPPSYFCRNYLNLAYLLSYNEMVLLQVLSISSLTLSLFCSTHLKNFQKRCSKRKIGDLSPNVQSQWLCSYQKTSSLILGFLILIDLVALAELNDGICSPI